MIQYLPPTTTTETSNKFAIEGRTNGVSGKTKPVKSEGKFISQIKKNLTQGKEQEGEQENCGSGFSKNRPTKTTEKTKSNSSSVFSRLSEPTISSAKKSVKAVETAKPNTSKGSKPTPGSVKDSPKPSAAKENVVTKKQPPPVAEKPKKSSEKEVTVENLKKTNQSGVKGEQEKTKEEVKCTEENTDEAEVEYPEILEFNREQAREEEERAHLEVQSANEEVRKDLGEPSLNQYLTLKNNIFEDQESTFCTLDINGEMATAAIDPQEEDGFPQNPTECIVISENKVKYINTNFKKVSAKMYDYKCDIKLKVGDQNFKAHRDVLSEASDYFSAMFSHNMKEKGQDEIELKDISPKGFSAMLDYFYHGHVTLEPSKVEEVIEGARYFHVDWLLEVSCEFLIQHLSLDNYNAVMEITDKYYLGDLRWDIFRFIGQNLGELTQQPSFFENLSLELLLQFLMENIYTEAPEFYILDVVLKWVKADEKNRKEHLLSLLRQIRFHTMETEELESVPPEVLEFPEIREIVEDAMNYSLNIMGQCLKRGDMYKQRGARPVVTILAFTDEANILVYRDPTKCGLFVEELGPCGLDTASYQAMGQAKIGNFLYAAGGYDDKYCTVGRVFMFDPKYRGWTEVASMNEPRVSFAMCNSDNRLFVVGGVNHTMDEETKEESEQVLGSVEMYNPEDNVWTNLQPMPYKSSDQAAVFANGCLYVSGGISSEPDDPVPLNSTWCLKVDGSEGWVPKANMLNGRQGHSITALSGKLYTMGGYTAKEDRITFKNQLNCEVYDLETGQWTEIAPTPEAFGHLFPYSDALFDKIFVMGGIHTSVNLYIYDPESDTWEEADVIGPNVQKLAILDVAYPYT
ncbi:kelch-like protein 15 [Saccostrea echinata]|uniref:kelch-like protein 15 n=1 Tax=Saccostrea echinata TaxID=191078 RepID=UPI002A83CC74|nr:kelch-like protein 15 [Saccostrea echinata]